MLCESFVVVCRDYTSDSTDDKPEVSSLPLAQSTEEFSTTELIDVPQKLSHSGIVKDLSMRRKRKSTPVRGELYLSSFGHL